MTQPTIYARQYNFSDFQTANPDDPPPGQQLDAELNAVKQTLDQICSNLALIQRDDTAIANNSVGIDQLKDEVDFGFNTISDWGVGVDYVARDGVWHNNDLYRCLEAHTSVNFAADLADDKWTLLVEFSTVLAAASASATAAAGSASAAATSATSSATSATLAQDWATKTNGQVAATDYSAKAWSIGGTGVTTTAGKGAAKEWATTTGGAVDTSEFSAKEYAVGATVTTGSSKDWASKTNGLVQSVDGSAKAWAVGGTGVTTTAGAGAAKEWAITTGGAVDTTNYSAKEHAVGTTVTTGSAKDWASKTNGLVQSIDGSAKAWSIGGTGITATASAGAAKEWATKTSAAVDTSEFSAKEYAQGSQAATGGSAKNWAQQTGADVTGAAANSRSAKSWAQDDLHGATLGGSAKDWAQSASLPDGTNKSAKSYAQDAATSATAAQVAAAGSIWRDVVFLTFADSPKTVTSGMAGTLFVCDTSGGAITVTLPQISTLTMPFSIGVKKESSDSNAVTINRSSTDTIDGSTSKTIVTATSGAVLIADTDPNPDIWTAADFGAVAGNMTVDKFSGNGSRTSDTLSVAPGSVNNVDLFISGVRQTPTTDYTVSGTTITYTTAPASGSNNILCVTGTTLSIGVPADATVTTAKLASDVIVRMHNTAFTVAYGGI